MAVSIIALPIFLIFSLLCFAIPVMIGVYVYRDSKKREMNYVLWTLLAIFAPGLIGFIVYLIVRTDASPMKCPACGQSVRESFSVCPYCGCSLKEKCPRCEFSIESGWENCPSCGEPIPHELRSTPISDKKKDKGLRRILTAAIVIPLVLCLVLTGGIVGVTYLRTKPMSWTMSSAENLVKDGIYSTVVKMWLDRCDETGYDTYVLKFANESFTEYLIYRNSGRVDIDVQEARSFSQKLAVNLLFSESIKKEEDSSQDYTLAYYKFSDPETKLSIIDTHGDHLALNITDSKSIGLSSDGIWYEIYDSISIKVELDDNVNTVCAIASSYWKYDELQSFSRFEDGSGSLTGTIEEHPSRINMTDFSFELLDANDNVIFSSEKYNVETQRKYDFRIGYNENNELAIIESDVR